MGWSAPEAVGRGTGGQVAVKEVKGTNVQFKQLASWRSLQNAGAYRALCCPPEESAA